MTTFKDQTINPRTEEDSSVLQPFPGCVGFYHFKEKSGSIIHDESGHGYDLHVTGNAYPVDGPLGTEWYFDGITGRSSTLRNIHIKGRSMTQVILFKILELPEGIHYPHLHLADSWMWPNRYMAMTFYDMETHTIKTRHFHRRGVCIANINFDIGHSLVDDKYHLFITRFGKADLKAYLDGEEQTSVHYGWELTYLNPIGHTAGCNHDEGYPVRCRMVHDSFYDRYLNDEEVKTIEEKFSPYLA